jgi:glycosyltransferase involved in cell wall biosynthesis
MRTRHLAVAHSYERISNLVDGPTQRNEFVQHGLTRAGQQRVIAHVLDFVPNGNRSMEQFLLRYATTLKEYGWHTVHVFAGEPAPPFKEALAALESPYMVAEFPLSFVGAVRLGLTLRPYHPLVIQTAFLSKFNPGLWILKQSSSARLVIVADQSSGTVSRKSSVGELLARVRTWCASRYIAEIVAVSDFVRDRDVSQLHFSEKQVVRVYNGVDTARFVPKSSGHHEVFTIVFAGQLIPEKGLLTLLRAIKILREDGARIRLIVAGTGKQEQELKSFCEHPMLKTAVEFLGQCDSVESLFSEADAVIVPSEWAEAFGFVAAEALACGACLIVSNAGGLPEIVGRDETAGLVFSKGDVNDLTAKLRALMTNAHRRAAMRSLARERAVSLFALESMVEGYCDRLNRHVHDDIESVQSSSSTH